MDGMNMSTGDQKKIMSFEEFCTAQLSKVADFDATQLGATPAPPEMQLPEPETDITMMDSPEPETGDTETPETDVVPTDTEGETQVEEPVTK